jgi:hypothetical protein
MRKKSIWLLFVCLYMPRLLWAQQGDTTRFKLFSKNHDYLFKVGALAPAFGYTACYIEESLKRGRSIEYQVNLIGLGENLDYYDRDIEYAVKDNKQINQKGLMLGAGFKFIHAPKRNRYNMNGFYCKPNIILGVYQQDWYVLATTRGYTTRIFLANVATALGRQWLIANRVVVDISVSLGVGIDNYNKVRTNTFQQHGLYLGSDNSDPVMHFGYVSMGNGGLSISGATSLMIGYLFHRFKK